MLGQTDGRTLDTAPHTLRAVLGLIIATAAIYRCFKQLPLVGGVA